MSLVGEAAAIGLHCGTVEEVGFPTSIKIYLEFLEVSVLGTRFAIVSEL